MVGLAVLAVLGTATFGLWNWANQPSKAQYINDSSASNEVKGTSTTLEDYSSSFFATKISSDFKVKNQSETQNSPIVGQYLLTGKQVYSSDQLAITIGTAKSTDINEVSGYKFRKTYPDDYVQTISDAGYPAGCVVFTKKSSYEKSVFWIYNGKYAAVVVSGGADHRAELENGISAVLANWQWL